MATRKLGRAGDQRVGAGGGDAGRVVGIDAAIDLEPDVAAGGGYAPAHRLDLGQC